MIAAASVLLVSGCQQQAAAPVYDDIPAVTADQALQARLPAEISSDGKLTIAVDPSYPPLEFDDNNRLRGVDIDLARAVSAKLGLTPDFQKTNFSNVVPAVAINQYELGISALWADNPEASFTNMVTYFQAGVQLAARAGANAPTDSSLGLCGHSVAVEEGTEYIDTMVKLSSTCAKRGKPPISIKAADNQAEATAKLQNGKADAMLADSPVVSYAVAQSNGELVAVGPPVDVRPYGIAVSPTYEDFAETVRQAVQQLIDSGVYGEILSRWNVESGAIATSEVIPGGLRARS